MTNRSWYGGNGDWFARVDWSIDAGQTGAPGAGAPIPGDTLTVNSGTINLIGSEAEGAGLFDNAFITIGQSGAVAFALESAKLGKLFRVTDNGSLSLLTSGQSLFDGRITTTLSGAVVTLGAMAGGSSPAGLTLFTDSILSIGSGGTLDVAGTVTDESRYDDSINILDVTGAFGLIGTFVKASTVQGDGAIDLGLGGKLLVVMDYDQSDVTNEGLATAELIHQVAPGAALAFASGYSIGATYDFASAVAALQNAGCNVIVDDLSSNPGPAYQVTGPLDQAVSNAIASGISYFTAAGNYGNDFLSSAFSPIQATVNGSTATANEFDNGTVFEGIDAHYGATYLDLRWAAPYFGPGETGAPNELTMELFNSRGQLVSSDSGQFGFRANLRHLRRRPGRRRAALRLPRRPPSTIEPRSPPFPTPLEARRENLKEHTTWRRQSNSRP